MKRFLSGVDDALHAKRRRRPWLAEEVGISVSTINGWFSEDRVPKADIAVQIARALETTVEYLATGEDPAAERLPPELAEICRLLHGLPKEQLAEIRGVIRLYVQEHFGEARAQEAAEA